MGADEIGLKSVGLAVKMERSQAGWNPQAWAKAIVQRQLGKEAHEQDNSPLIVRLPRLSKTISLI